MVRKKVEGNEEQRRAAAREARRAGEAPSARKVTTGASKQKGHLSGGGSPTHEQRLNAIHQGKQQHQPGPADAPGDTEPAVTYSGRGRPGYTEKHERVFQAVAQAADGITLDTAAREAGLPKDETRTLLHDLMEVHGLVTELQGVDAPDLGPRYELRPSF
ncbi:hypothetical protein SMC26_29015 [Actinomadura fulvescens]|uniref:Uncharacterized protein n=1 Tax=Actinomadura fulvescens TaxID=46160 RepID=A0ABP6CD82_9ACTN